MKFFLQREGRTYGPYSFDDLKRYQTENRIGPNDLIRREDSEQWQPWQQLLNAAPAPAPAQPPMQTPPSTPAAQPGFGATPPAGGFITNPSFQLPPTPGFGQPPAAGFGQPQPPAFGQPQPPAFGQTPPQPGFGQQPGGGFGQPPAFGSQPPQDPGFGGGFQQPPMDPNYGGGFGGPQYGGQPGGFGGGTAGPMPPSMQWWLVLIIGFFTCSLFWLFWLFNQALFVKKIDPQNNSLMFYIGYIVSAILGVVVQLIGGGLLATGSDAGAIIIMVAPLFSLAGTVCFIVGNFKMRKSIHDYYTMVEPMGINLMDTAGGVMTFFFSIFFFQHHFYNIAMQKKAMGQQ